MLNIYRRIFGAKASKRLALPEPVKPVKIAWGYLISITSIHLLALLAFNPWYFSWTGLVLMPVGVFFCGLLGITLGYHRMLTHQGLVVPKWFERFCATCGVLALEDTPARWVAIHRMHHKHSDEQDDPHSPLVNFWWSHVGWLFIEHREHSTIFFYEKYARDILRDPYYLWLERKLAWFWVYALHLAAFYIVGFGAGWWNSGELMGGVQFGSSLVVWGVFVRTVITWNGSWSVNSLTHVFGYRNYDTKDKSRNFWPVAVWAYGEGWHNNHHADQRAAVHGHKWWEFDTTYQVIRVLMLLGIAKEVVLPRAWTKELAESKTSRGLAVPPDPDSQPVAQPPAKAA
jgi:fatty-acid desaturase